MQHAFLSRPFCCFARLQRCFVRLRACLHEGGGPQLGDVTRLGGVKNNPPLYAILQPRHPGIHFFKIIEWSLSS